MEAAHYSPEPAFYTVSHVNARRLPSSVRAFDEVLFLVDGVLGKASALEDALGLVDHLRVPAGVGSCFGRGESARIDVLSEDVFGPSDLPGPSIVFPRPAYGGHVLDPVPGFGEAGQFLSICAQLPRSASPVEDEHPVRILNLSVVDRPDLVSSDAHVRPDACDGGDHDMLVVRLIENEASDNLVSHPDARSLFERPQPGGEAPVVYPLDEKLKFGRPRCIGDGVGPEERAVFVFLLQPNRCILTGCEGHRRPGL